MAKTKLAHKKTLWRKVKLERTRDYAQAWESVTGDTAAAVILVFGPMVGYGVFAALAWNSVDDFGRGMMAVLCGIVSALGLGLYRPGRFVRLYPFERVAQVGRRAFGITLFSRWTDLGDFPPRVVEGQVMSKDDSSAAALGCAAMLLGPLGAIIAVIQLANRKELRHRAFDVYVDGRADPDTTGRRLARFEKRRDARRLVELYEQVLGEDVSDT